MIALRFSGGDSKLIAAFVVGLGGLIPVGVAFGVSR